MSSKPHFSFKCIANGANMHIFDTSRNEILFSFFLAVTKHRVRAFIAKSRQHVSCSSWSAALRDSGDVFLSPFQRSQAHWNNCNSLRDIGDIDVSTFFSVSLHFDRRWNSYGASLHSTININRLHIKVSPLENIGNPCLLRHFASKLGPTRTPKAQNRGPGLPCFASCFSL